MHSLTLAWLEGFDCKEQETNSTQLQQWWDLWRHVQELGDKVALRLSDSMCSIWFFHWWNDSYDFEVPLGPSPTHLHIRGLETILLHVSLFRSKDTFLKRSPPPVPFLSRFIGQNSPSRFLVRGWRPPCFLAPSWFSLRRWAHLPEADGRWVSGQNLGPLGREGKGVGKGLPGRQPKHICYNRAKNSGDQQYIRHM